MERFLFSKIEAWLVLLVVLVLVIFGAAGTVLYGAVLRNEMEGWNRFGKLGDAAVRIAELPATVERVFGGDQGMKALKAGRLGDKDGWATYQDSPPVTGYLLLSRFDGDAGRHVAELVDLSDHSVRHRWAFDADTLFKGAFHDDKHSTRYVVTTDRFRAIHPLLLDNGDLLIKNHDSAVLRVDACADTVWRNDALTFHHSTNVAADGTIWIPSYVEPVSVEGLPESYKDFSLARIDADGTLLENTSVAQILLDHGMYQRLFGTLLYADDNIHLNDIQPVLTDGPYWKAGDLFLSLRNISTIALYRPSENRIVWMHEGPWSQQHDVDIIDDHTIAVFDNAVYNFGNGQVIPISSDVVFYDFRTDTAARPFAQTMLEQDVRTKTEGLFEILPGGNLLVEEENSGRILIFDPNGTLISDYVNRATDGNVYRLGWSRYVDQAQAERALAALDGTSCG